MRVTVQPAALPEQIEPVRALLREYAVYLNESLGEEHICQANYERELAGLPGPYAEPKGAILLAWADGHPAGCVALKPLSPSSPTEAGTIACEMKRLWVRSEYRGHSLGFKLAEALIDLALGLGYTAMYLDTVPGAMKAANGIYRKLGFMPIERYDTNSILGENTAVAVEFFRLALTGSGDGGS
jgi:GNAT superfamily N-acetyltransferase